MLEQAIDYDRFVASFRTPEPPAGVSAELRALWYDGAGNWTTAHRLAQDIGSDEGSWIHAYLHRVEGDLGNAAYWYTRAGRPVCKDSLAVEFATLVRHFLAAAAR